MLHTDIYNFVTKLMTNLQFYINLWVLKGEESGQLNARTHQLKRLAARVSDLELLKALQL